MKRIAAAVSLLVCLSGTSLLVAADNPLVAAAGNDSGRTATAFATESGGEELEAFALEGCALLFGSALLFLAYRTVRKGRAKLRAVLLALLGIGLMAGGILYGQMRLNQIAEKYREIREKEKQGRSSSSPLRSGT